MVLRVSLNGGVHDIVSSDARVYDAVQVLFAPFLVSGDSRRTLTESKLQVYGPQHPRSPGGDTPYLLLSPEGSWTSTTEALPATLEYTLLRMMLNRSRGVLHLHGAGAVHRDRALVVTGPSEAGKSSIALAWSHQGIPVLGDDILFLSTGGIIQPFPRLFKAGADRCAALGIEVKDTPYWQPHAGEIWFDPASPKGGGWGQAAPLGVFAVLDRRVEGEDGPTPPSHTQLTPSEVAQHILAQIMATGDRPAAHIETVFDLAERVRGVRLTYSDSSQAAAHLLTL